MAQKGHTNNPNGRPAGAKEKLSLSVKTNIIDYLNDNIDNYFDTLNSLQGRDYVRCMTELIKLIVPRPLNEAETDAVNVHAEMIKRLFN